MKTETKGEERSMFGIFHDEETELEEAKSIPEEHKTNDIAPSSEKKVPRGSEYHPTHSYVDFIF